MTLYRLYQLTGGTDEWVPIQDSESLEELKPTFVTVLACDTLLNKSSARELLDSAKYYGPMYFDLDSKDISESIAGAKALWIKLKGKYKLTEADVDVYLSGKKGLHLLISPTCFMEKQVPVSKLPAIYKEIAFNLAVDTLDFAVYSGGMGRMFRTHYNKRENDKYKVQITIDELESLTPESYDTIAASPRPIVKLPSKFSPQFAILYEGIRQKIAAQRKVKSKPTDAATLARHLPTVQRLMKGEAVREGTGFNKIAIQLAIYAREAKLSEDELVENCAGLIANHSSDSYRYNTSFKREAELRRMFRYLEENSSYDYSIGPIKSMLEPEESVDDEYGEDSEDDDEGAESGLILKNGGYYISTEQGDKHILDAKFKNIVILRQPDTEQISCMSGKIVVGRKVSAISLERADLSSSSALHKAVSLYGASFTGTDVHARYIFTHMLRESKSGGKTVYATEREGLDVLSMPMSEIEDARKPFIVWSDANGVILPENLVEQGLDVRFMGYPTPEGVMKTDLAKAPPFPEWIAVPGNKQAMLSMLRGLLGCQSPASISKLIGWMTSCFYSQLFRRAYGKFPLMHINGVAGSGKSETVEGLMHMFYYKGEPLIMSPASTNFALISAIAGSASIPVIVDEYKPHTMNPTRLNELKANFRSSYNTQSVSKGGGNRTKDNFAALNTVKLTGPVMFIAEAIEQETALLERCVVVTLRRPSGLMYTRYAPKFNLFKANQACLAILGQQLAADIISGFSVDKLRDMFEPIHYEARKRFLPDPDAKDLDSMEKSKWFSRPRTVYNHAVAEFGVHRFKAMLFKMFPEESEEFVPALNALVKDIYVGMDEVAKQTLPEYVKVLLALSDMSRFPDNDPAKLNHEVDFEIGSIGDTTTIALVGRLVYNRYKQFCRRIGDSPLFPGDGSFIHAVKDSDLFIRYGPGTKRLEQETLVLNYDALQRLGCAPFKK